MPQNSKTPAGTGASRDGFGDLSLALSIPLTIQAQFLKAAYIIRPKTATMIAALADGGEHD